MLGFPRGEILSAVVAIAAAVFFLVVTLGLPGLKLFGIDWKIALFAAFGFLTFRIYRWSQGLFAEIPP